MKFKYISREFEKIVAIILVGTIAGTVSFTQSIYNNDVVCNELLKGYYTNEDVKRNREELFSSIESGSKSKSYGKKNKFI